MKSAFRKLITRAGMNAKISDYAYGNRERSQNNFLLLSVTNPRHRCTSCAEKVDLHTPQRPSEGNRSDGRRSSMTKRLCNFLVQRKIVTIGLRDRPNRNDNAIVKRMPCKTYFSYPSQSVNIINGARIFYFFLFTLFTLSIID